MNKPNFSLETSGIFHYEHMHLIGEGSYGVVMAVTDKLTGAEYALKRYELVAEEGIPQSTVREIAIMKLLGDGHPNIIKLIDVFFHHRENCLSSICGVYEKCDMDLECFLKECQFVEDRTLRKIAQQILLGTEFLHMKRVIHRDLKPANILINSDLSVKLTDFGLSRRCTENARLTPVVVTIWYRAPESLLKNTYNTAIDVWSIGCIFAELYTKKPLFSGDTDYAQLNSIIKKLGTPSSDEFSDNIIEYIGNVECLTLEQLFPGVPDDGRTLFRRMIQYNPVLRPTCTEALHSPYFTNIEDSDVD